MRIANTCSIFAVFQPARIHCAHRFRHGDSGDTRRSRPRGEQHRSDCRSLAEQHEGKTSQLTPSRDPRPRRANTAGQLLDLQLHPRRALGIADLLRQEQVHHDGREALPAELRGKPSHRGQVPAAAAAVRNQHDGIRLGKSREASSEMAVTVRDGDGALLLQSAFDVWLGPDPREQASHALISVHGSCRAGANILRTAKDARDVCGGTVREAIEAEAWRRP